MFVTPSSIQVALCHLTRSSNIPLHSTPFSHAPSSNFPVSHAPLSNLDFGLIFLSLLVVDVVDFKSCNGKLFVKHSTTSFTASKATRLHAHFFAEVAVVVAVAVETIPAFWLSDLKHIVVLCRMLQEPLRGVLFSTKETLFCGGFPLPHSAFSQA